MEARQQAQDGYILVYAPQPGQALQGLVPIDVSMDVPGLVIVSIEFRYANHPSDSWFLIAQVTEGEVEGIIAQWDTTTITDGDYDLRLVATTQNQQELEVLVAGLRVRNYSPVETDTPTPIIPTETLLPGDATRTPQATPTLLPPTVTPLPTNPAIFTPRQLVDSMGSGALLVLGLFGLLGIYIGGRDYWRNRG